MIHISRAKKHVSIENNLPKVTGSLGIISHSVVKLALESYSAKKINSKQSTRLLMYQLKL